MRPPPRGAGSASCTACPIALKDNIETAGVRTTSGAAYLADHIPNSDAPVVGRLKAQGAVLIGKANMQELAWGVVSTNPVVGQCRNPWNPERIPGGSSGGSGATGRGRRWPPPRSAPTPAARCGFRPR